MIKFHQKTEVKTKMQIKRPVVILAAIFLISSSAVLSEFSLLSLAAAILLLLFSAAVFFFGMRHVAIFLVICAFVSMYPALYQKYNTIKTADFPHNSHYTATVEKISYGKIKNEIYLKADTGSLFPSKTKAVLVTDNISSDIKLYDRIEFDAELFLITDDTSDGIYLSNPKTSYISSGYYYLLYPKSSVIVKAEMSKAPSHIFHRYITSKLNRVMDNFGNTDGFSYAIALLTGDKSLIPRKTYDLFARSGLIPLLCISGLHVTIACSLLSGFLGLLKTSRTAKSLILIAFLCVLVSISGGGAPIVRASLMSAIFITLDLARIKTDTFSVLATVFCIMSLLNPFFIFSTGSALSFLAISGVYCAGIIQRNVNFRSSVHKYIQGGVLTGFFATGFTAPVMVCVFGGFNLFSPFSNIVASIIFAPLMYLMIILAVLSFLPEMLLAPVALIVSFMVGLFEKCAVLFASIPFSYAETDFPGSILLISFILGAYTVACCASGKSKEIALSGFLYATFSYSATCILWFIYSI